MPLDVISYSLAKKAYEEAKEAKEVAAGISEEEAILLSLVL